MAMGFAKKLAELMGELGINQTKLHELTGIGRSSISQYLAGKHEPGNDKKREIARALGVQDNYFNEYLPAAQIQQDPVVNLPVPVAAKLMGKSVPWVQKGLQDGIFPWGYAVKLTRWSYFISSVKFTEYTGIEIPVA